jgi:hypothetical protein
MPRPVGHLVKKIGGDCYEWVANSVTRPIIHHFGHVVRRATHHVHHASDVLPSGHWVEVACVATAIPFLGALPPVPVAAPQPTQAATPAPVESGGWSWTSTDMGSIFYQLPISISSGGGSGGSEFGGSGTIPTPEPASLLLLAPGIASLAALQLIINRRKVAARGGPQA